VDDEGKDWDKLLHCIIFVDREVPQTSTGFSPFELVYGRPVRGPLDLLQETLKANNSGGEDDRVGTGESVQGPEAAESVVR